MTRTRPPADDRVFRRKEPESRVLTSERIAKDLRNFQSSGGRIEILGVTPVLKKLEPAGVSDASSTTPARQSTRGAARRP